MPFMLCLELGKLEEMASTFSAGKMLHVCATTTTTTAAAVIFVYYKRFGSLLMGSIVQPCQKTRRSL